MWVFTSSDESKQVHIAGHLGDGHVLLDLRDVVTQLPVLQSKLLVNSGVGKRTLEPRREGPGISQGQVVEGIHAFFLGGCSAVLGDV